MNNPELDFLTVIKTSIPSITKHPRNISPSSKRNTNQSRITFKPNINKPHLLSFLHSMYNSIKLINHCSLNFKKRRENTNKLPHTPTKNTSTSSKTRIHPISSSVLILTQFGGGNSYLTEKGRKTLLLRVLIPKNIFTLKSNISFFIEVLDEFSTRQIKSLITEIALETSILS